MEAAYLVVPEKDAKKKVDLSRSASYRIGRNDDNDIVLPFESVSRYHAILQHSDAGEYYLMDMGSRNGSFVNGARVSFPVAVKDGDRITVGDEIQMTFHWPGAGGPPAPMNLASGTSTVALFSNHVTTVLVVDVRDFTRLTQQIGQSLLCQVIGAWFRGGGQIMQEHGSWAQKYIGDALMSVWVHRKRGEEHLEIWKILKGAVDLVKATAELQSQFRLASPLRIGIGINTGSAMVGNTGTGRLNDYTAMGDTVNAAFRFESATKDIGMDLIIGQDTFDRLAKCSDPASYFRKFTVQLKGYDNPCEVWGTSFGDLGKFVQEPARS